jgi:hypothetical protein
MYISQRLLIWHTFMRSENKETSTRFSNPDCIAVFGSLTAVNASAVEADQTKDFGFLSQIS